MHHQQAGLASVRGHRSQGHDVVVAVARCLLTDLDPLCTSAVATRRPEADRSHEDGLQDRHPALILETHGPHLDLVLGPQDAALQRHHGGPDQAHEAAVVRAATLALHGGQIAAGHDCGRSRGVPLCHPVGARVTLAEDEEAGIEVVMAAAG